MTSIYSVHADIRAAFRAALLTIPDLPTEVAWEGRRYTPPAGAPYMRETVTPASSDPRALGRGGTVQHRILCRVQLFYPAGSGTVDIERAAGALLLAMRPGTSLVHEQTSGMVFKAERSQIMPGDDFVNLTVTVTVTAYTAN